MCSHSTGQSLRWSTSSARMLSLPKSRRHLRVPGPCTGGQSRQMALLPVLSAHEMPLPFHAHSLVNPASNKRIRPILVKLPTRGMSHKNQNKWAMVACGCKWLSPVGSNQSICGSPWNNSQEWHSPTGTGKGKRIQTLRQTIFLLHPKCWETLQLLRQGADSLRHVCFLGIPSRDSGCMNLHLTLQAIFPWIASTQLYPSLLNSNSGEGLDSWRTVREWLPVDPKNSQVDDLTP